MGEDLIPNLGIYGVLAYLFISKFFDFLNKRKNGANGLKPIEQSLGRVSKQLEAITKQMHEQILDRTKTDVGLAAELRMLRKELERRPCLSAKH